MLEKQKHDIYIIYISIRAKIRVLGYLDRIFVDV